MQNPSEFMKNFEICPPNLDYFRLYTHCVNETSENSAVVGWIIYLQDLWHKLKFVFPLENIVPKTRQMISDQNGACNANTNC